MTQHPLFFFFSSCTGSGAGGLTGESGLLSVFDPFGRAATVEEGGDETPIAEAGLCMYHQSLAIIEGKGQRTLLEREPVLEHVQAQALR